ncbi:MAG: chromate transporter [bacterium]|nr:chromate transporter [bacterium]
MIILELFLTFFKIGAFTFGGGYAMLPLIQEEVTSHGWMSMEQLVNFIAVSESTPGPFAVNTATYIGTETAGFFGAAAATLGVVLPSFIIILIIAKFFSAFSKNRFVIGCMNGLKPAVIAMIASAVLSVAQSVFFHDGISLDAVRSCSFISSAAIFVSALILTFKKLHPIAIILISAALGIIAGYILPA